MIAPPVPLLSSRPTATLAHGIPQPSSITCDDLQSHP